MGKRQNNQSMKYVKYIFLTLAVILIGVFAVRFLSGEDDWICDNGEWVKHGSPSMPAPDKYCGREYIDGENISWEEAKEMVSYCQTKKIGQAHSLDVNVWLHDGTKLNSKEPVIDDIIKLAESVNDKCGTIQMMTE